MYEHVLWFLNTFFWCDFHTALNMILIFKDKLFFFFCNLTPNWKPSASFTAIAVKDSFDNLQFLPCLSKVLFQCASLGTLNPHIHPEVRTIISIYQMKKLRLSQGKASVQGRTARKWWHWIWNQIHQTPKPNVLLTMLHCFTKTQLYSHGWASYPL